MSNYLKHIPQRLPPVPKVVHKTLIVQAEKPTLQQQIRLLHPKSHAI